MKSNRLVVVSTTGTDSAFVSSIVPSNRVGHGPRGVDRRQDLGLGFVVFSISSLAAATLSSKRSTSAPTLVGLEVDSRAVDICPKAVLLSAAAAVARSRTWRTFSADCDHERADSRSTSSRVGVGDGCVDTKCRIRAVAAVVAVVLAAFVGGRVRLAGSDDKINNRRPKLSTVNLWICKCSNLAASVERWSVRADSRE